MKQFKTCFVIAFLICFAFQFVKKQIELSEKERQKAIEQERRTNEIQRLYNKSLK